MADTDIPLRPGVLLIAPPLYDGPHFRRSVVLLCEHGVEGSFGLILNRPLSLTLGEVMDDAIGPPQLSFGGPVQPNTLHYLHRHGEVVTDAVSVLDGVFWGGDFEFVRVLIDAEETSDRDLRLFLGYAGWSPGQLEEEVEEGGWILARGDAALVFPPDPGELWRQVLRQMGGEYAVLANFPDDPRMN